MSKHLFSSPLEMPVAEQVYGNTYLYDQKIILSDQADSHLIYNKKLDGTVQEIKEVSVSIICPDDTQVMKQLTILTKDSPLVKLMHEDYSDELQDLGVGFSILCTCDEALLNIDIGKMRRVMGNIIGNSIKHTGTEKLEIAKVKTFTIFLQFAVFEIYIWGLICNYKIGKITD